MLQANARNFASYFTSILNKTQKDPIWLMKNYFEILSIQQIFEARNQM